MIVGGTTRGVGCPSSIGTVFATVSMGFALAIFTFLIAFFSLGAMATKKKLRKEGTNLKGKKQEVEEESLGSSLGDEVEGARRLKDPN